MIPKITKNTLLYTLLAAVIFPGISSATQHANIGENLSGYFSRDGNNASPSETTRNNIYIKFFEDRWIAMLFIPYPYATSVESSVIERAFHEAKKKTSGSSYLRGKFGHLAESATVQIERYGYLEDRIVFECGSLAPCTIRTGEDYLELIKPGVINEHIIRYNHVNAE
jgi:hypothetical protein